MINRSSEPRTDLPYLRRRSKPGCATSAAASVGLSLGHSPSAAQLAPPEPVAPPTQSTQAQATPPSLGLTLGRPSAPATTQAPVTRAPAATPSTAPTHQAARPSGLTLGGAVPPSPLGARGAKLAAQREMAKNYDHEVALLFPAPGIKDVYELNFSQRVLRLNALESAVGTLVVSGSTAAAWETNRRVTGGQTSDGHTAGTPVMTSGNRPLVGYDGPNALISLRHVRDLRRALFINRGARTMGVQIFGNESVALPPAADGTQLVLLVHRIGNVLELRAEPVPLEWSDLQIWAEFDFSMTHRAPAPTYR